MMMVMMIIVMKTSTLGKPSSAPRVQLEVLDNFAVEEVPALQVGSWPCWQFWGSLKHNCNNNELPTSELPTSCQSWGWQFWGFIHHNCNVDDVEDNFLAGASHVAKMLTLIIMILMLYKIKYLTVDCVMLSVIRGRLIRFLCKEGDVLPQRTTQHSLLSPHDAKRYLPSISLRHRIWIGML